MKHKLKIRFWPLLVLLLLPCTVVAQAQQPVTVKQERNHVRAGNRLYQAKRYNDAEVEYRKALEANPRSAMAQFNLASALLREDAASGAKAQQQASKQHSEAVRLLANLEKSCSDPDIASKSSYDLGNLLYKQQNYQEAIAHYEQALRKNPGYDNARYNLRMAQLKLKQSKNNKQSKNKKQNKNNKNDKNKGKNKNKDKNQNKQNHQNKQDQKRNQRQGGMSSDNMDQILRTMQNQENATRQRVEQRKAQMQAGERARTQYKW